MFKNFRLKITMILIVFSLILSILIAVFDYIKLKNTILNSQETQIAMAEDKIIDNLSTIDNVYDLFDTEISSTMEGFSEELLKLYEEKPDFEKWDYKSLKEKYKMDIFILDDTNTVIHSSFPEDIGLSFSECCPGFSALLNNRREEGVFSVDGMDIQSNTGEVKKFSYMPTPDRKFLIELGYLLEDEEIFKRFNFLKAIDELVAEYEDIVSIKVYNSGGNALGIKTTDFNQILIQPPYKEIFEKVRGSGESDELIRMENGQQVTYRYIPYSADEQKGYSTKRVVEIAYNNQAMSSLLSEYKNQFLLQLTVILFGAVALSLLIGRLVSTPIHMAFHDSLTGLKNRLAFENEVMKRLDRKNQKVGLMMIDLDNFKSVNDHLGHGEGDRILKIAASTIEEVIGHHNFAARVGGDEFTVLIDLEHDPDVKELAKNLIHTMDERMGVQLKEEVVQTSISIGVAVGNENDTFDSLYEKADIALYQSKQKGKNQYNLFQPV